VIRRGDVRWFRFASPDKHRPVLVVGRDDILDSLSQVPWEVALGPEDGLPSACLLKPEWIRAVGRAHLGPWIGALPNHRWPDIRRALLDVLGLEP
jgi:mRNA interferase MazF